MHAIFLDRDNANYLICKFVKDIYIYPYILMYKSPGTLNGNCLYRYKCGAAYLYISQINQF